MSLTRFRTVSLLVTCALVLGGCSRKPAVTGPTFHGRLLVLVRDSDLSAQLVELTPGSNEPTTQKIIASGMFEAVSSPDEKRLLYSNRDGVFVRDLASGADRQMAAATGGTGRCLGWAPDGNRISFRASDSQQKSARAWLSVSDLNGKTKVIWESWVGGTSPDCDVNWIAPDRLIFDRVLGVSAQQQKAGAVLLPNTTTMVILKEPVSSIDMEARWSIRGICPVGNAAVLTPHYKDGPIAMATDLNDLKTVNPSPVSCSVCKFAGFAAKSCVPFFLEMGEGKNTGVFSLNPVNWQRQRTATIDQPLGMMSKSLVSSSAKLMVVGDGSSLFLVNTDSGEHTNLLPQKPAASSGKKVIAVEPVLWFEN